MAFRICGLFRDTPRLQLWCTRAAYQQLEIRVATELRMVDVAAEAAARGEPTMDAIRRQEWPAGTFTASILRVRCERLVRGCGGRVNCPPLPV